MLPSGLDAAMSLGCSSPCLPTITMADRTKEQDELLEKCTLIAALDFYRLTRLYSARSDHCERREEGRVRVRDGRRRTHLAHLRQGCPKARQRATRTVEREPGHASYLRAQPYRARTTLSDHTQAGLFSAVSSAFIVESYKQMLPDFTELTYRALAANISGKPFVDEPFVVDETSRTVNCLWIASLVTSLSTALIAILAKQWLASYPVHARDNLREWAQLRQFRFDGLKLWRLPELIALIPVLLHVSLMLFLAGLVVFLWGIDSGTMALAFVLSFATYGTYVFATFSPVFRDSSPFRTPLTPVLRRLNLVFATFSPVFWASSPFRTPLTPVLRRLNLLALPRVTASIIRTAPASIRHMTRTALRRLVSTGTTIHTTRAIRRVTESALQRLGALRTAVYTSLLLAGKAVVRAFLSIRVQVAATASHSGVLPIFNATPASHPEAANAVSIPPVRDPWIAQDEVSPRLLASSLSWLGTTAETHDTYRAVVSALWDPSRGSDAGPHIAEHLRDRLKQDLAAFGRDDHIDAIYYVRVLLNIDPRDEAVLETGIDICRRKWRHGWHLHLFEMIKSEPGVADTVVRIYCHRHQASWLYRMVDDWEIWTFYALLENSGWLLQSTREFALHKLLHHSQVGNDKVQAHEAACAAITLDVWHQNLEGESDLLRLTEFMVNHTTLLSGTGLAWDWPGVWPATLDVVAAPALPARRTPCSHRARAALLLSAQAVAFGPSIHA